MSVSWRWRVGFGGIGDPASRSCDQIPLGDREIRLERPHLQVSSGLGLSAMYWQMGKRMRCLETKFQTVSDNPTQAASVV